MRSLPNGLVAIAPGFRLQWDEAQRAYVLLYPEGMIKLNPSAAEILKRCDGSRKVDAIVADLQQQYSGTDLSADVCEFLEVAYGRGWIGSR